MLYLISKVAGVTKTSLLTSYPSRYLGMFIRTDVCTYVLYRKRNHFK